MTTMEIEARKNYTEVRYNGFTARVDKFAGVEVYPAGKVLVGGNRAVAEFTIDNDTEIKTIGNVEMYEQHADDYDISSTYIKTVYSQDFDEEQ